MSGTALSLVKFSMQHDKTSRNAALIHKWDAKMPEYFIKQDPDLNISDKRSNTYSLYGLCIVNVYRSVVSQA